LISESTKYYDDMEKPMMQKDNDHALIIAS